MMHMTHPTSAEDALDIAHESRETAKLSAGFPALLYFSLQATENNIERDSCATSSRSTGK